MQPHTLLHKNCWINLQCTHAVISLLLQSRKFWWYLLLTSYAASWCHNDVIRLLAIRRVSGRTSSRTVHRHTAPRTCKRWTAASRNTRLSCAQHVASKNSPDLNPVNYEIWVVMQRRVYNRRIHSVDELKRRLIDVSCGLEKWTVDFDEAIDQWRGRHRACVHANGGHFEYSLWTANVDFVHICYIQCALFDCCIFNY